MKLRKAILALSLAAAGVSTGAESGAGGVFELLVPELKLEVSESSPTTLPSSSVNRLQVRVLRSSQEVPPGKIILRINGEAANTIMYTRTDQSSITCDLDLNFRPGFLLHAGRNAIEASAESIYGRAFYAVFLLDVHGEPQSLRGLQWETVTSKPGETPPRIQLIEPQGVVENERELTVNGVVEGGIPPFIVMIQGESVPLKEGSPRFGSRGVYLEAEGPHYSFKSLVALSSKQESIEIIAVDAHRNRRRVLIPVIQGTRLASRRWAVVIGVSHYSENGIDLQFADRDAEAMRDFLEDPKGGAVPQDNMFFRENEQATSANLRSALFDFLSKPGPDDLVIVYFAGHGVNDPKSPDNYYLLTYDSRLNDLGGTAVRMRELQESFGNYLKANLVALVDSCHSGGVGKAITNMTNARWQRAGFGEHRAIITASQIGESSREDQRWGGGHGVFTYYVLQGLKGAAAAHHGREITVGELFDYVQQHVSAATQGNQSPVALDGSERSFVLTQDRSGAARSELRASQLLIAGARPQ